MLSSSRSQTIGNQSSSRRQSRSRYHRTPHAGETMRAIGVHVSGLPETNKIDRLEKFMMGDKAPHRRKSESTLLRDPVFHVHYYQWYNGNVTTGEGVYVFNERIWGTKRSGEVHRVDEWTTRWQEACSDSNLCSTHLLQLPFPAWLWRYTTENHVQPREASTLDSICLWDVSSKSYHLLLLRFHPHRRRYIRICKVF